MNDRHGPSLGSRTLGRIGYGAMRLPGIRGTPVDGELARQLLHDAVRLGARVIDTADFYGRGLANRYIADALSPYPDNLVSATKVGVKTGEDGRPVAAATADEIRASVKGNLDTLGLDCLDLVFLRLAGGPLADSGVPLQESVTCLAALQAEGVIRHIGLSSASVEQINLASRIVPVEAVQNAYFIGHTDSDDVLRKCSNEKIPFFAYFPLGMGRLISGNADLARLAADHGVMESQVALAWLLALSPMMLPIPGTSSRKHLDENMAAANLRLSDAEVQLLSNAG